MRKAEIKVLFGVNFVPKGEEGDEIKQKLNRIAGNAFEKEEKVVRHELESSRREYLSRGGKIISEFTAYVSDDVNFNNGEVDPINDSIWSYLVNKKPRATRHSSKDWDLDDVLTENVEHITSTIEEDKRVNVDLDQRGRYSCTRRKPMALAIG